LDSVQKTVNLANKVLSSIRKGGNDFYNENEDLITLAQSIDSASINACGSSEGISLLDDSKPANSNNPFMTAKQALARNNNQKAGNGTPQSSSSGLSSHNPAAQARKMLGAKRRFVDPKSTNEPPPSGYRDEGRDINTEFR